MDFGIHRILSDEQRRVRFRYPDEVLYAIGMYLMSLEPPKNPKTAPKPTLDQGEQIFRRKECVYCHVPPNYTSGKLTLAQGYEPPADVWYRTQLLHDGSVAGLEEMFNPTRLGPDHVPGGRKGPGVERRAIPGHRFGLDLKPEEKDALLAFLRSL